MISVVDKIDIGMVKVIVDADAQLPSFVKVARREWSDSVTYVPIENVSRLQREKFKLEDENTKLKRENEVLHKDCDLYNDLIRILYYCGQDGHDCDQCAMNGADMHVELEESCYCDGLNDAIKQLDVLDQQNVIKL